MDIFFAIAFPRIMEWEWQGLSCTAIDRGKTILSSLDQLITDSTSFSPSWNFIDSSLLDEVYLHYWGYEINLIRWIVQRRFYHTIAELPANIIHDPQFLLGRSTSPNRSFPVKFNNERCRYQLAALALRYRDPEAFLGSMAEPGPSLDHIALSYLSISPLDSN